MMDGESPRPDPRVWHTPAHNIVHGVRKIAVLRANGVGDMVFALPAVAALRSAYPQAEIVLIGSPWHASFLPGRGVVDRVVVAPPYAGVREDGSTRGDEEHARFFRGMADEAFDLAIQMHGGGANSNPFVSRLGARVTVGLQSPDAPPLDLNLPYVYYHNEYLRYIELVSLVGAGPTTLDPILPLLSADFDEAKRVASPASPFAVLHAGASDPRRRWPADRFALVGDWLATRGLRVLVTGSGEERQLARSLVAHMHEPAWDISGQLTLGGLAGLLSAASIVVSNDSGPLHLATAVRAPAVGIYWCGNAVNSAPPGRDRHRMVISWQTHCPLCGAHIATDFAGEDQTRDCAHSTCFVDEVSVDQVLYALTRLVDDLRALDPSCNPPTQESLPSVLQVR